MTENEAIDVTPDPLTPDARAIGSPEGTPVVLGDGRTWVLSAHMPQLGGVWDTLYDDNVLAGQYERTDLLTAAFRLLLRNYRLEAEEAFGLVGPVESEALVPAVERAFIGGDKVHRTLSDWIQTSLMIAGLDPASVPDHRRWDILDALEMAGRIPGRSQFISSAEFMQARRKLLDFSKDH